MPSIKISDLVNEGWNISDQYFNKECQNIPSFDNLKKKLLNENQKLWGCPLIDTSSKNKLKSLPSPVVLQITNIVNLSAPKANPDSSVAPRLLKIHMTDGKNSYPGIEISHIKSLSMKTPPGSKIKLTGNITISSGFILLNPQNIQFLGGNVEELVENWKVSQGVSKYNRIVSLSDGSGPPPWVPFGKAIVINKNKNFKALDKKDTKPELENERKQAVQALTGGEMVKKFGGGKQMLDTSVKKIVDAGFTIDDAEWALKKNRNDVNRALNMLKGVPPKNTQQDSESFPSTRGGRGGRKKFGRKNRGFADSDEESDYACANAPKPSGPATLTDFLTNRIGGSSSNNDSSSFTNPMKQATDDSYVPRQHNRRNFEGGNNRKYNQKDNGKYHKQQMPKQPKNPMNENYWPSIGEEPKSNQPLAQVQSKSRSSNYDFYSYYEEDMQYQQYYDEQQNQGGYNYGKQNRGRKSQQEYSNSPRHHQQYSNSPHQHSYSNYSHQSGPPPSKKYNNPPPNQKRNPVSSTQQFTQQCTDKEKELIAQFATDEAMDVLHGLQRAFDARGHRSDELEERF